MAIDDQRVRDALFEASELPPDRRPAFLAAACGGDPRLRAEVESLLRALDRDARFLDDATDDAGGGRNLKVTATATVPAPGSTVGPFRLVERIGQGGMGVVYLAEQDRPVRRRVALKMIRPGLDAEAVVARFDLERQSLALMDHPNVARIYTAGSTDDGRPYFAMEWVQGQPITRYCDDRRLTPGDRLGLFAVVCRAVQHAHQQGVIHRDLKPGNILVAEQDGRPVPKVIDFGVAKALGPAADGADAAAATEVGRPIGTLEYMSPEQADAAAGGTDTRSDVYSLGVVLYELLTGATPLGGAAGQRGGYEQALRLIRDSDPPRPSTRLSDGTADPAASADVADRRRTPPRRLAQMLTGDLDCIVMMCLAKDRGGRYDSAGGLARDVERYLAGEPVVARPPTVRYQLSRLARRHKPLVAGSAAVAAALVLGTAGTSVGLVKARAAAGAAVAASAGEAEQRRRAEARFADVRQLADDLMFKVDAALRPVPGATPARRVLADTSLRYLDRLAADAPADDALAADLAHSYEKVGNILGGTSTANVGDVPAALASYRKMNDICGRLARDRPSDRRAQLDLAQSWVDVGDALATTGDTAAALADYRKAIAIETGLADGPGPDARRPAMIAHEHLGTLESATRHRPDALDSYRTALSIAEARFAAAPADPVAAGDLANVLDHTGTLLALVGHPAEGRADLDRANRLAADRLRRDPTDAEARDAAAGACTDLGIVLSEAKAWPDAVAALRHGLDLRRELVAADPVNARYRRSLYLGHLRVGDAEAASGDRAAAADSYAAGLAIAQSLSDADPGNAAVRRELSVCYKRVGDAAAAAGRFADARAAYDRALEIRERLHSDDPANVQAARDLASNHLDLARIASELTVPDAHAPDRLLADYRAAAAELAKARAVYAALKAAGLASPAEEKLLAGVDAEVRDAEDHIAALGATTRPTTNPGT